jgi:glutaredoxin 3
MARVEIYTRFGCPFCDRALALLDAKGAGYEETDVGAAAGARQEMIQRAGGRTTVPQIFIDGRHVGGSDDLAALDREGQLDAMLQGEGAEG